MAKVLYREMTVTLWLKHRRSISSVCIFADRTDWPAGECGFEWSQPWPCDLLDRDGHSSRFSQPFRRWPCCCSVLVCILHSERGEKLILQQLDQWTFWISVSVTALCPGSSNWLQANNAISPTRIECVLTVCCLKVTSELIKCYFLIPNRSGPSDFE